MLMLTSTLTFAQPLIGVRAGANWSRLVSEGDGIGTSSWHSGYSFGVVANWAIANRMCFQAEVLYAEVGEDAVIPVSNVNPMNNVIQTVDVKMVTSLKYVQVPLLLGYTFGEGKVRLITQGGMYLGFALGGETALTGPTNFPQNGTSDYGVGEGGLSALDVGFVFNPGVRFGLGEKSELGVDLRYTQGFTEVWNPKQYFDQHNKVVGISLLYLYKF